MALVLWMEERKLPEKAKEIFEEVEKGQTEIMIPAMVFAELAYLSEVGKIDPKLCS